ncbi:MAG TPA: DUF4184 family protein [Terracidiphilus sp.]|nr:DUF4184 family protein [Terracidiphilus sp.]
MPFTPAHAAAVLPFHRTRLVFSALLVGSFAPDFEYFLRMAPHGGFGHTPSGMFLFSLPAAMVVLWLFHRYVKPLVAFMLPRPMRERMMPSPQPFAFAPRGRLALIAISALVGIATHIGWDSFTHPASPLVRHFDVLQSMRTVPLLGTHELCRILQFISTIVGLAILGIWTVLQYRRAERVEESMPSGSNLLRAALWIALPLGAAILAALRVWIGNGGHLRHLGYSLMIFVIAWIAFLWWEMVVVGYFADSYGELKQHSRGINVLLTPPFDTEQ